MSENPVQGILDTLEKLKGEVEGVYEGLGLGRDQVIRTHEALDVAKGAVASHQPAADADPEPEPEPEPVVEPVVEPAPVVAPEPPVLDDPAPEPAQ